MPHEQIPTWTRDPAKHGTLAPLGGSRYRMVDAHLHVVNFMQDTPGGASLIEHMDRANVSKAVVFGLPVTKEWSEADREEPDYYLANDARCYYYAYTDVIVAELVRSLAPAHRERLFPLLCGFNPTDKKGIRHVERLFERYPDVWCGIGEVLLRHDDLTALTHGDAARANHRALWPVYEFAGERDLPVLVHHNVTSVACHTHPIYLWEFEEAVRDFPRTRFVLAHCGMSRRVDVPFYYQMVERLLDQYPNVCVDYSWIIYDVSVAPGGVPSDAWLALTERHHTRIVLGSDLVTRFERLGPELQRYDAFLERLDEQARDDVCWRNAERIYARRGPVLC